MRQLINKVCFVYVDTITSTQLSEVLYSYWVKTMVCFHNSQG